jgi:hypothetical protein
LYIFTRNKCFLIVTSRLKFIKLEEESIENHANPSNIHIYACVLGVENERGGDYPMGEEVGSGLILTYLL